MTEQEIKKQIAHAKAVVSTWPVWKQNILVDSTVSSRQTARTPVIKTSAQVVSKLTSTKNTMKKKKKKKLEDAGWKVGDVDDFLGVRFGETVVKRLLIDKEFKKGLEKEIIDAILKEDYYMAHIMLKDLIEYKERREES